MPYSPDHPEQAPDLERIEVRRDGVFLEPTEAPFEQVAVLNPTCLRDERGLHMYYRAIDRDGISSIGYALVEDGATHRLAQPLLKPEYDFERGGLEDPRITQIDDIYLMVYVAFDGQNCRLAGAISPDLRNFEKIGIIGPEITAVKAEQMFRDQGLEANATLAKRLVDRRGKDTILWNKDAMFFPDRCDGQLALMHRILPDIQVTKFDRLAQLTQPGYWETELSRLAASTAITPTEWYESRHVGGGATPILTDQGWLVIYHGVTQGERPTYYGAAALLDRDDPAKLLAKLPEPLFGPEASWELEGTLEPKNVVFPTAVDEIGDELQIYYGCADERIAKLRVSRSQLLKKLT